MNEEQQNQKEIKQPFIYDFVSIICTALIVIMVVFTFFFRFVGVVGDSMNPTLYESDWLLVRAINSDGYEYGDIIISTQPNAFNEPIVKRVIATGGQTVDIDFETGDVYVDGELLQEDYIAEPTTTKQDVNFPVTVPEGCIFAMGDNRNDSTDSRSTAIGMIDERYIIGKVLFRILPFNQFTYFE
ncbi:MAG: signal peptidase I [Clostridia bacterium]|nr:signal peptidase I [Clostridia bacterium]